MFAQNITVRGTVLDAYNEPVIGGTVIEAGNPSHGTITDIDGNYVLWAIKMNVTVRINRTIKEK
jgi:hypothetical protein